MQNKTSCFTEGEGLRGVQRACPLHRTLSRFFSMVGPVMTPAVLGRKQLRTTDGLLKAFSSFKIIFIQLL